MHHWTPYYQITLKEAAIAPFGSTHICAPTGAASCTPQPYVEEFLPPAPAHCPALR